MEKKCWKKKVAGVFIGLAILVLCVFVGTGRTQDRDEPAQTGLPDHNWAVKTEAEPESTGYPDQRKLAITSDGHLHVIYHRKDGNSILQIYHAESADGGRTWVEEQVTNAARDQNFPSLAVDSKDNLHVVWQDGTRAKPQTVPHTYYNKKTAEGWQAAELVASYATTPSIAVDSNDDVHVVYGAYVYTPGYYGGGEGIRWRKKTSTGWQTEEIVSSIDRYWERWSAIAIDSNNDVHVVWDHAPRWKYYDKHYRKRTSSGWGTEVEINTDKYNEIGDAPSIAIDSDNYIHIVWQHLSVGYYSIKYLKYTTSWQPTEDLVGPTTYIQLYPTIATDGKDNIHVVWSGQHSGSPTICQIRYKKHTTLWQPIEDLTSSTVNNQTCPNLMWALHPTVNGVKTNRPEDGYSFVWTDDTTIKYWVGGEAPPPPPGSIYVDGTNGDDSRGGESWATAVKTIQRGIDLAETGFLVLVANGTYTGTGNKDLDFNGKAIHLESVGGAANCIIDCENSGRGFYFHSGETVFAIIEGFTIRNGNTATYPGGGGVYCYSSSPTITNCTFSGNSAQYYGGGISCEQSSPTFTNCTISGNSASEWGGGVDCDSSSPTFTNCTISGNTATGYGGGVDCYSSSPTFTNCTISGNSAHYCGGGVYCYQSSATFTNCTISGNSASEEGGGVFCEHSSSPTFTNCTISGNSAHYYGGGVSCYSSSPTFTNCTITNNTATGTYGGCGGGVSCESSSPTFRNSIIWGNTANSDGNQIYTYDYSSSVTLSYSCYANGTNDVAGSGTITPDNCINTNPLFVGGGNYHLQATSPCIDIGNNSYVPAGVTIDLDGNPRIAGSVVDMGAYEYQTAPPPEEWSFAIITDLHIGRGYPEYNGEDYYLKERLEKVVDWINANRKNEKIKFLVVLGDIADNSEYSKLAKAKQILDRLEEIPYFPVLGNHDVWSDGKANGDSNFNEIFDETFFRDSATKLGTKWRNGRTIERLGGVLVDEDSYLQNYAFVYNDVTFVALDFVARTKPLRVLPVGNPVAVGHESTMQWLNMCLAIGKPTILLSHHPMAEKGLIEVEGYGVIDYAFNYSDVIRIGDIIWGSGTEVLANFAGHLHGWSTKFLNILRHTPFMDANKDYKEDGYFTPYGIRAVVTTEAVMVASNDPTEPYVIGSNYPTPKGTEKGVIRIVKMRGNEIVLPSLVEGFFPALNPSFDAGWPDLSLAGVGLHFLRKTPIKFEAYAFTKMFTQEHPLWYYMSFGDGKVSEPKSATGGEVPFEHTYDNGGKYNVTLLVKGQTPEGEIIREEITQEINVSDFGIFGLSPIDIIVTDPDGLTISKQLNQIPEAIYTETDFNGDGDPDDVILIPHRKIGNYVITVIPELGAAPTDTYTLEVLVDGASILLADKVQISNIPALPYVIRATETGVIPIIPAVVDLDPDTLNLKSKGQWVTAYIELPVGHGYAVSQINVSSIRLNGTVPALAKPTEIGDHDKDGIPDLMVKFDRAAVQAILQVGDNVEITVNGSLTDGRQFEGKDIIRVKN